MILKYNIGKIIISKQSANIITKDGDIKLSYYTSVVDDIEEIYT